MAEPYPKKRQLARGGRRYRREVASPKQWQAIIAEKGDACRTCGSIGPRKYEDHMYGPIEYHHLVARAAGGDDVAANVVPLHRSCHERVTARNPVWLEQLAVSLEDDERSYCEQKLGAGWSERLFGVGR